MRTRLKPFIPLAAALAGVAASGCAVIGVVADKVAGPPPVKAQYAFGPLTPVLVLVENYRAPSAVAGDGERIAEMVGNALNNRKAATALSPEKLLMVRDARPGAYARMTVVDVGKAVGAHQVVYVDLDGITVGASAGSDMLKGVGRAKVRVIDVSTGRVVFPQGMTDGATIEYTSPLRRATGAVSPAAVRGETLVGLSGRIARLFYDYQAGDLEALDPEP